MTSQYAAIMSDVGLNIVEKAGLLTCSIHLASVNGYSVLPTSCYMPPGSAESRWQSERPRFECLRAEFR